MPTKDSILAVSTLYALLWLGISPAWTTSDGSPPHNSIIIFVAASIPKAVHSGSIPLSKRYRASEFIFNSRPV